MKRRITRRSLSAGLLAVPALAQVPPQAATPKPVQPGEDLRANASRQIQNTAAQLRKFVIPAETEPAFRFKA